MAWIALTNNMVEIFRQLCVSYASAHVIMSKTCNRYLAFIASQYDSFWWIGWVKEIDYEHGDILVTFMHPHGPRRHLSGPQEKMCVGCHLTNLCAKFHDAPKTMTGSMY